ncbi:MAG: B12-binding domain-containing radical SAM protein [Anaerolineae bacterium]|nr:B12-binding domain-containing radical SAM protein [Anaerolineae bacterium]
MKVLLASPESEVWNSRKHIHMGLGYLAGSLLAHGYECEIWDASVESDIESLDEKLARDPFDIVCLSAPTPLIVQAWEAARTAKKYGALTILGGPHLTLMPHESMERPEVDLVVRGEGEYTIIEIMRALEKEWSITNGQLSIVNDQPPIHNSQFTIHNSQLMTPRLFDPAAGWGNILGLSWRDKAGKIKHNLDRPLPDDIDAIPFPAFHMFKIDRYTNLNPLTDGLDMNARAFTIVTSRGCPYKCTYCSKPITGDTWRGRSVDNVIAEWEWLVKDLGATEIGITDDIWNLDKNRAKELCRALIKANLNHVPWVTIHGMKVNNTDAELFKLMKQAGCKRVGFGVENGDDWMLRHVIKKGQTVDMVRQAFKWSKEAKLQTMGFFIFGMPGETEESMEKTIRLSLELDPDLAHFMMAAPFPGTEMWETLKKHGDVFSDSMDWSQIAIQDDKAHFAFGDLDKETVERKWHEAHRRFYLRPKRIARIATRKDTWQRFPYYLKTAANMLLGLGEREATAA